MAAGMKDVASLAGVAVGTVSNVLNHPDLVRPLTRRLPPRGLLRAIEITMPVLFPVTSVLFSLPLLGKVAK